MSARAISPARGPDPIDEAMNVTTSAGWLQLTAVAACVLGAIVWAAFTEVPIKVTARGILLSRSGVADVVMSTRGRILAMDVQPGDAVAKDDLIAEISQPDLETQLSIKEVQLREARARQEGLVEFQQRSGNAQTTSATARIAAAQQRLALLADRERALRERDAGVSELLRKGLSTKEVVLRNQAELTGVLDQAASAQAEIVAAGNELRLQKIQSEKEMQAVGEEISRLAVEVEQTQRLLTHNRELRSPYAGRVIEVKYGAGEFVDAGAAIISLDRGSEPGQLVAIAFVPPDNGKEVKVGMPVQLAPSAVKTNEYGFIVGRVTAVSDAPATAAGMQRAVKNETLVRQLTQQGAPFQIEVSLETASTPSGFRWTSSNGPNTAINSGTPVEANVVARESRLLGLVIPPLARFFAR